jgi:sporulation-control protein spo0M
MTPEERRALIKARHTANPTCKPLELTPVVVADLRRRVAEIEAGMIKRWEVKRAALEASFEADRHAREARRITSDAEGVGSSLVFLVSKSSSTSATQRIFI